MKSNKILLFNHVFWPDKLNTARHISELCEELVKRNWNITALIGNRSYVDKNKVFKPDTGIWKGVKYTRCYLPPFDQTKNIQRLLSSFWLIITWIFKLPFLGKFDVIIIGTNPPFSFIFLPFLRLFNKKSKILMWSFDVYPEAIYVSKNKSFFFIKKILKIICEFSYKKLDVMVDIGPCMKEIYDKYDFNAKNITLTPWSFVEPEKILKPHIPTRLNLFKGNELTLLYTGTIGNAHEFDLFLRLARYLRTKKASVGFCFAGFGNRFKDLKSLVTNEDYNITFSGFVESDEELQNRLSTADIMLISLKKDWTGISVPSKYFSALSMGKVILFAGSKKSSLSIWTKKYNLGYVLQEDNVEHVGDKLIEISLYKQIISEMKHNSFDKYNEIFSKKVVCDNWSELLNGLVKN